MHGKANLPREVCGEARLVELGCMVDSNLEEKPLFCRPRHRRGDLFEGPIVAVSPLAAFSSTNTSPDREQTRGYN